jgi:hypothetical protein
MKTYELYYNDGGHCGPFYQLHLAVEHAERMIAGCVKTTRVEIRPDSSGAIGGYAPSNPGSRYIES